MTISQDIYTRDSHGKLRFWRSEVDEAGGRWRGISGIVGGAEVVSGWTSCVPKSQPTAAEQAHFEAGAECTKKLDRKYRDSADADFGDVFIQPMLAYDFAKRKEVLQFPVVVQPKLDGIRAIITVAGATTRQGQPIDTIDHILADLAPVFARYPDLVLDGELYNHAFKDDFNSLTSVIRRGFKLDKKSPLAEAEQRDALARRQRELIQYHVYDIADVDYFDGWDRLGALVRLFYSNGGEFQLPSVVLVTSTTVQSREEMDELMLSYLETGYEGQMVRLPTHRYQHSRSPALLKRKVFETKEFKLLRIEEGNGNWAGKAKRVVVELEDGRENEAGIRGTFNFAAKLLAEKHLYEGGEVTLRFMRQRTPDGKLRTPVAIDFHPGGRKD